MVTNEFKVYIREEIMKICITGSTGYVGSQIVRELHFTSHELCLLVRKKDKLPDEIKDKHEVRRVDLSKDEIDKIECDILIHCAALVSEKTLSFYLNKTNVEGTRKIMNAIPVSARVVFISCANIYNITNAVHFENEKINPVLLTPYGRSKLQAENILQTEFKDRDISILRIQDVYGKRATSLYNKVMKLYKNGRLNVPGNLNVKVSLTNIDYLIEIIKSLINTDIKGVEIYNIVDSKTYILKDVFLQLLNNTLKKQIELNEKSEIFLRIIAGLRTVLVPGNQFTQTTIDYLTKDHLLSNSKVLAAFPTVKQRSFDEHISSYTTWVTNNGISTILDSNARLYWS